MVQPDMPQTPVGVLKTQPTNTTAHPHSLAGPASPHTEFNFLETLEIQPAHWTSIFLRDVALPVIVADGEIKILPLIFRRTIITHFPANEKLIKPCT